MQKTFDAFTLGMIPTLMPATLAAMAIHYVHAQTRCIARLSVKTDPLVSTLAMLAINPNARNKTQRRDVSSRE